VTPPGNVLRAYSTWAITIGVSSFMNFALGAGLRRSADEVLIDLIVCGLSTAVGLAAASIWWDRRSDTKTN